MIVETEAYPGGDDRASHTYGERRTRRNASMWLDGGHAYVYFVYGMHHCVNVVSGHAGQGEAVLVRALAPLEGLPAMRLARGSGVRDADLCSGPARLTQALGVDRSFDGVSLVNGGELQLLPPEPGWRAPFEVGPRIGVDYAGECALRPWRYRCVEVKKESEKRKTRDTARGNRAM